MDGKSDVKRITVKWKVTSSRNRNRRKNMGRSQARNKNSKSESRVEISLTGKEARGEGVCRIRSRQEKNQKQDVTETVAGRDRIVAGVNIIRRSSVQNQGQE